MSLFTLPLKGPQVTLTFPGSGPPVSRSNLILLWASSPVSAAHKATSHDASLVPLMPQREPLGWWATVSHGATSTDPLPWGTRAICWSHSARYSFTRSSYIAYFPDTPQAHLHLSPTLHFPCTSHPPAHPKECPQLLLMAGVLPAGHSDTTPVLGSG